MVDIIMVAMATLLECTEQIVMRTLPKRTTMDMLKHGDTLVGTWIATEDPVATMKEVVGAVIVEVATNKSMEITTVSAT